MKYSIPIKTSDGTFVDEQFEADKHQILKDRLLFFNGADVKIVFFQDCPDGKWEDVEGHLKFTPTKSSHTFSIGDVVQLKSGGPLMTVSSVHTDWVHVTWFHEQMPKVDHFKPEMLTTSPVETPPKPSSQTVEQGIPAKASEGKWIRWSEDTPSRSHQQNGCILLVAWTDAAIPSRPMGLTPFDQPKGTHWAYLPEPNP